MGKTNEVLGSSVEALEDGAPSGFDLEKAFADDEYPDSTNERLAVRDKVEGDKTTISLNGAAVEIFSSEAEAVATLLAIKGNDAVVRDGHIVELTTTNRSVPSELIHLEVLHAPNAEVLAGSFQKLILVDAPRLKRISGNFPELANLELPEVTVVSGRLPKLQKLIVKKASAIFGAFPALRYLDASSALQLPEELPELKELLADSMPTISDNYRKLYRLWADAALIIPKLVTLVRLKANSAEVIPALPELTGLQADAAKALPALPKLEWLRTEAEYNRADYPALAHIFNYEILAFEDV